MVRAPHLAAIDELQKALAGVQKSLGENPSPATIRRVRSALADHAIALEDVRASTDPIGMPRVSFDPNDPNAVGRMVSIALLAQEKIPLDDIKDTYGSGVYAIYYQGDHPFYVAISGTETPIYVGKADPQDGGARNPREQGAKLTGRLIEHRKNIKIAEAYAPNLPAGLSPIAAADFSCRRLVCATNAQLVAERHLITTFWPIWNSETRACWGMSKHGDSADTRSNKRSPWDVVHPGRTWALPAKLQDALSPAEIKAKIDEILATTLPYKSHADLLEKMLEGFRQGAAPEPEAIVSPLGAEAPGPEPDEAGEEEEN